MYRILFINDDSSKMAAVSHYNQTHRLNYNFTELPSSADILKFVSENKISLILISCTLKGVDTDLQLVHALKHNYLAKKIPLVLCTKKESVEDYVEILNKGADDFFVSNLPIELLFSRINAILRKNVDLVTNQPNSQTKFIFMDGSGEIEFEGRLHKLSSKEFTILKTLVTSPGKIFSQVELNEISSGKGVYVSKRCIDTFVSIIRNKIGKESIISIRNQGYKINEKLVNLVRN